MSSSNSLPDTPLDQEPVNFHQAERHNNNNEPPSYASQFLNYADPQEDQSSEQSHRYDYSSFSPLPTSHAELIERLEAAKVSETQIAAVLSSRSLDLGPLTLSSPSRELPSYGETGNEPGCTPGPSNYIMEKGSKSKDSLFFDIRLQDPDTSIIVPQDYSSDYTPRYVANYQKKGHIQIYFHSDNKEASPNPKLIAKVKYGSSWHRLTDMTIHGTSILTWFHEAHAWDNTNKFNIMPRVGKNKPKLEHAWILKAQEPIDQSNTPAPNEANCYEYQIQGQLQGNINYVVYKINCRSPREGTIEIPAARVEGQKDRGSLDAIVTLALSSLEWHKKMAAKRTMAPQH